MTPLVEDMSVNHGRRDIRMAQELLNGSDVVARFQQVGGPAQCGINSRMANRVTSHAFDDPSLSNGLPDGPLEDGFVEVTP